jgi:hypothetical protein
MAVKLYHHRGGKWHYRWKRYITKREGVNIYKNFLLAEIIIKSLKNSLKSEVKLPILL